MADLTVPLEMPQAKAGMNGHANFATKCLEVKMRK